MSLDIYKEVKKRDEIFIKSTRKTIKNTNMKNIHDMRVAYRRFETSIETYNYILLKEKKLRFKNIKKVFKILGKMRDIQIQKGIIKDFKIGDQLSSYIEYLDKEFSDRDEEFKELLKQFSVVDMEDYIKKILKIIKSESKKNSKKLKKKSLKKIYFKSKEEIFEVLDSIDFEDVESIHIARLYLKKYRYRLEVISSEIKIPRYEMLIIAKTQDIMGEIQDIENLLISLENFYGSKVLELDNIVETQKRKIEILKKEHIPEIK